VAASEAGVQETLGGMRQALAFGISRCGSLCTVAAEKAKRGEDLLPQGTVEFDEGFLVR